RLSQQFGGSSGRGKNDHPNKFLQTITSFRQPVFGGCMIYGCFLTTAQFVVFKRGDLFLDHGDFTGYENIISRFSHCSLRPLSCSADVPSLRLSKQVLRPSKGDAGLTQPPGPTKRCLPKAPLSPSIKASMLSSMSVRRRCTV